MICAAKCNWTDDQIEVFIRHCYLAHPEAYKHTMKIINKMEKIQSKRISKQNDRSVSK